MPLYRVLGPFLYCRSIDHYVDFSTMNYAGGYMHVLTAVVRIERRKERVK